MDSSTNVPPQTSEVRALYDLMATLRDPDAFASKLDDLNVATARHNEAVEKLRVATVAHASAKNAIEETGSQLRRELSDRDENLKKREEELLRREATHNSRVAAHEQRVAELGRVEAETRAAHNDAQEKQRALEERERTIAAREASFADSQQRFRSDVLQFEAKIKAVKELAARLSQP
jgi:chromosome segregation ATPase